MKLSKGYIYLAVVILLLGGQFLYDPISSVRHYFDVQKSIREFTNAQERWLAVDIREYSFVLHGSAQDICRVDARIYVENNTVVNVLPVGDVVPLPPEKWSDPDWGNEVFLCDYHNFTFPRMFEMFATVARLAPDSILLAEFDDEFGFLSNFKDGIFVGGGWLSPTMGDCCTTFRVEDFQASK